MKKHIFFLVAICFILVFSWFKRGLLFAGGEEGIPFYDIQRTTGLVSSIWRDASGGYFSQGDIVRIPFFTFLSFLQNFFKNGAFLEALTFFILMVTGVVSIYFLINSTVGRDLKNTKVGLISAIFYLLNPFSMTQIWGRGLFMQFFPFALHPFFLLMVVLGLERKKLSYAFFAICGSFIFSGAFGNPSYAISLWFLAGSYFVFYLIENRKRKDNLIFSGAFFVFLIIGWVLTQMWWIWTYIATWSTNTGSALGDIEYNLGSLRGVSRDFPLTSVIRLMQNMYFFRAKIYGDIYLGFIFGFISWIIPFVSLFSLSVIRKSKHLKYFVVLFLISIFIVLGSNFPLKWLFEFLFVHFPLFSVFRNPYEKFGLVFSITYLPFFTVGVLNFSNKVSKYFKLKLLKIFLVILILFLISGVFSWPMWTGIFSGGFILNPWVEVPNYYREANDWLNRQDGVFRIIQLPLNPGDGVRYKTWSHPYWGAEPSEFIFDRPSISKNGQSVKAYYNVLLLRFGNFFKNSYGPDPDITNSEFRSDKLYEELEKLGVRYIVFHRDIDEILGSQQNAGVVENYLSKQEKISKTKTFGDLDIYRVDIPENVELAYSPDAKSSVEKINAGTYKLNVSDAKNKVRIYLLENFDRGWEAFIDGQKIDDHFLLFSYANGWSVSKNGSFTVLVRYKAQDYVETGMKISIISLLMLAVVNEIYLWIPRR